MSQMEFIFNREWIKEMCRGGKNPVRILERAIASQGKYLLVKSDSFSLTIESGEDGREQVRQWLEDQALQQFPDKLPKGGESLWAEKNRRQILFDELMSACPKPVKREETEENGSEEEEQQKKKKILKLPEALEKYLEEWGAVVPGLKKADNMECLWSRNLLVAMDEGYGMKEFLSRMALTILSEENMGSMEPADMIKYTKVSYPGAPDKKYDSWDRLLDRAAEMQQDNNRRIRKMFLVADLSQWRWELRTSKVREYLSELTALATNFICVFHIPYTDDREMEEMAEVLEGELGIKILAVPPLQKEQMLQYVKEGVENRGFQWSEEGEAKLKDWLELEKERFHGLRTLERMIHNLVYDLTLHHRESGRPISGADVASVMPRQKEYKEPYKKLDELIGLEDVKRQVRQMVVQMKTLQELRKSGKDVEKPTLHMMFTGNPGTGKTTVARIVAQIMKEEGVLSRGQFFEIKGRDLCGRFVGETAPKTSNYCRDAQGSVLFIDEAYGLCQNRNGNDYGREALNTLITEMENHRDDFCVIMAGYEDEMQELFSMNSGLESRIPHQIRFTSYTREELKKIFFQMLDRTFEYDAEVTGEVERFLEAIPEEVLQSESFSNGRMIRNFYERIWGKAAYRRYVNQEKELRIRKEDVQEAWEEREFKEVTGQEQKETRSIGF